MSCNFRGRQKIGSFGYIKSSKTIFFIGIFVPFIFSFPLSSNAHCLADYRKIKVNEGSAKIKSLVCEKNDISTRVEFYQLSEAVLGAILKGEPHKYSKKMFGNSVILKNEVYEEAVKLFKNFGTKYESNDDCFHFEFSSTRRKVSVLDKMVCKKKTIWYLGYPDVAGFTSLDFPLKREEYPSKKNRWPVTFNYFLSVQDHGEDSPEISKSKKPDINFWRYLNKNDLSQYMKNWSLHNKELGLEGWEIEKNKQIKLLDYITSKELPKDFIIIYGSDDNCDGNWDFVLFPRQLIFNVVVIENLSNSDLSINGLIGEKTKSNGQLNEYQTLGLQRKLSDINFKQNLKNIRPKEKLLIPLNILFRQPIGIDHIFKGQLHKLTYSYDTTIPKRMIQNEKDNQNHQQKKLFEQLNPTDQNGVKKSLGFPKLPGIQKDYLWGPQLEVRGFKSNNVTINFLESPTNIIELTAGEGYGSCPYLYSYDRDDKTWLSHGKIIHKAKNKDLEQTEEIPLHKFTTRFKISEEELELAYIDEVRLKIILKDGSEYYLQAIGPTALYNRDNNYLRLIGGRSIEFSFSLPVNITEAEISKSSIMITGYYERYTTIRKRKKSAGNQLR